MEAYLYRNHHMDINERGVRHLPAGHPGEIAMPQRVNIISHQQEWKDLARSHITKTGGTSIEDDDTAMVSSGLAGLSLPLWCMGA